MLKERGAEKVLPELEKWVDALDPTDPGYEHYLLEAVWVCDQIGMFDGSLVRSSYMPRVRSYGQWRPPLGRCAANLSGADWLALVTDRDSRAATRGDSGNAESR